MSRNETFDSSSAGSTPADENARQEEAPCSNAGAEYAPEHTPTPWEATGEAHAMHGGEAHVWGPDGDAVATCYGNIALGSTATANARRIVACVNYCAGYSTDDLVDAEEFGASIDDPVYNGNALLGEVDALRERVVELEEVIEEAVNGVEWYVDAHPESASGADDEWLVRARAALASTEDREGGEGSN